MRMVKWAPRHVTQCSPATGFGAFDGEFDRLMDWAFGGTDRAATSTGRQSVTPAMDVVEEEDRYQISFDLPGLSKDDVEITFEDGILTLKGEKKSRNDKENVSETEGAPTEGRVHRRERFRGSFERTIRLPEKVDPDKMAASFRNGVLELTLPFVPEAKPRKIEIQVNG